MSHEAYVLSRVDGSVGYLTLNEPRRLNPVSPDRIAELASAAEEMSERDDVNVVVLTGAGRGFCSGADLAGFETGGRSNSRPASGAILSRGSGLWILTAMRQPVIAMVNGPAVGFGFELALQADIRIAGTSATFGVPFGRLGTVSDTGAGSWLLPRLVGYGMAAEIFYTGKLYSADEAHGIGMVNHVVPDEELAGFTQGLAGEIAANSGWALSAMKTMFFDGLEQGRSQHVLEQFRLRNHGKTMEAPASATTYLSRFVKD